MRELGIVPLMLSLLVLVAMVAGCAVPAATPTPTPTPTPTAMKETERIVKVEAEGIILHYQGESLWSQDEFSTILQNRDSFNSNLIEKFIEDVSEHGEREEHVANALVEFNEYRKSTILRCDIEGAVRKSGTRYNATFFWLLRPLGLDFIDSSFEKSERGLFWEGLVNSTPTTITITLPASIGHCHAHVWWELPS